MAKTNLIRPIHERYILYKTKTFRFQGEFPWKRFYFFDLEDNRPRIELEEHIGNKPRQLPFSLPRLAYFAILEK